MRLPSIVAREIVEKVLLGEDYRPAILHLIDTQFLNRVVDFFKAVVDAKLSGNVITSDWYRTHMLSTKLPKEEIAARSGLNLKTIINARHTQRKEVVIEESLKHYEKLRQIVEELIQDETTFGVEIKLTFRDVSVSLDVAESLIVINALAVTRATIRGGAWSTAGKQVEQPLMTVLCALHRVPRKWFEQNLTPDETRESDFYLTNPQGENFRCEVKLLGKGNPESADAAFARDVKVFVADTISEKMKKALDEAGILWMELRGAQDWAQFSNILNQLNIPHKRVPEGKESEWLQKCLDKVFSSQSADNMRVCDVAQVPYTTESSLLVELD
ncbi:MAG: type II restriction enzyme [Fimbriimonadales bacterium]|nr:MAG: type II restriction enzyme [Fimbriimonadales bacterium]